MKLPEEVLNLIAGGKIGVVYKTFRLFKNTIEKEEYNKIRNGINLNFDLNDYLMGNFTTKKKTRIVIIDKNTFSLEEFWTELEEREDLMRKIIYENVEITGTLKGRLS